MLLLLSAYLDQFYRQPPAITDFLLRQLGKLLAGAASGCPGEAMCFWQHWFGFAPAPRQPALTAALILSKHT